MGFLFLEDVFDLVLEDGLGASNAAPSVIGDFASMATSRVFLVVDLAEASILVMLAEKL